MPCENCQAQFTVFRRKRCCPECKRFYCSSCLSLSKRTSGTGIYLCRRCSIFAKRPLLRSDLLQLKPKDLIFYLQSKQISVAGCVEKDELINLVLTHVEQVDNLRRNSSQNHARDSNEHFGNDTANSFEGIKQTCQNFFTNLSDNITETFATFDSRKPDHHSGSPSEGPSSPTVEQPRVYFREMPSYASAQTRMEMESNVAPSSLNNNANHVNAVPNTNSNQSSNNYHSSPSFSVSSASSVQVSNHEMPVEPNSSSTLPTDTSRKDFDIKSDCECSDDDIMLNFSERHSLKTDSKRKANINQNSFDPLGPSTSKAGSQSSKLDVYENLSHSSFEELGAIGGNSDDINGISPSLLSIQTATTTTANENDPENEMDVDRPEADIQPPPNTTEMPTVSVMPAATTTTTSTPDDQQIITAHVTNPPEVEKPKVVRRRSDSYLTRRRALSSDLSPTSPSSSRRIENSLMPSTRQQNSIQELEEPSETPNPRLSCTRCGKSKGTLRRHVERMRRHLQNSQMSDEDIKKEMSEFLEFLENRQRSLDQSDNDTIYSSASGVYANQLTLGSPSDEQSRAFDENEGIHVYATNGSGGENGESRFINIDGFKEIEDLEMLTVKELKEILMLHRVDFKGCCEKQELLERVQRLWKTLKSTPAVEKLPSDEVCKICMDAPIECVILECGHMATCTSCGKVLNECPICRQYIVRVVRFFRA